MINNLIAGEHQPAAAGTGSLPIFNPATGEVIDNVPLSGAYRPVMMAATCDRSR